MLLKLWKKNMSGFTQLRREEKAVFQNKMIQVVYQLFNALRFKTKGFTPLFSQKELEKTEEKMQTPLWFKINKPDFEKTYDSKHVKQFWTKVTTSKISKNESKKLYKELIQKDVDALEREKSNSIKKKYFKNSRQHRCNI